MAVSVRILIPSLNITDLFAERKATIVDPLVKATIMQTCLGIGGCVLAVGFLGKMAWVVCGRRTWNFLLQEQTGLIFSRLKWYDYRYVGPMSV